MKFLLWYLFTIKVKYILKLKPENGRERNVSVMKV
jgi:hypothetical protein